MRPSIALDGKREIVRATVCRYRTENPCVFGSVLKGLNASRLLDYLEHIHQAATTACAYVEGLSKADFLADARTQQAVVMNLIIIGEAAAKLLQDHSGFAGRHA